MYKVFFNNDIFTEILLNFELEEILKYSTLNKNAHEILNSNYFWKTSYYNKFYYIEKSDNNAINYMQKYKDEIKRRFCIREIMFSRLCDDKNIYLTSEFFNILYEATYNGVDLTLVNMNTWYDEFIFTSGFLIQESVSTLSFHPVKTINILSEKYNKYIPGFIDIFIKNHNTDKESIQNSIIDYLYSVSVPSKSEIYISASKSRYIEYDIDKISFLLYIINNISLFSVGIYSTSTTELLEKIFISVLKNDFTSLVR